MMVMTTQKNQSEELVVCPFPFSLFAVLTIGRGEKHVALHRGERKDLARGYRQRLCDAFNIEQAWRRTSKGGNSEINRECEKESGGINDK